MKPACSQFVDYPTDRVDALARLGWRSVFTIDIPVSLMALIDPSAKLRVNEQSIDDIESNHGHKPLFLMPEHP
jgi:hypothetical protein